MIATLKNDMKSFGVRLTGNEWRALTPRLTALSVPAGSTIENQIKVANRWIFMSSGIAASEQTWTNGKSTIVRFFEPGDLCANLTSVWTGEIAADELIAVTDIIGIAMDDAMFRREYLSGDKIGLYLRHKVMAAQLYAKELASAKTVGETELRYQFLERFHPSVIANAPQKEVARFLGVTPQSLSRFLRRRKTAAVNQR